MWESIGGVYLKLTNINMANNRRASITDGFINRGEVFISSFTTQ